MLIISMCPSPLHGIQQPDRINAPQADRGWDAMRLGLQCGLFCFSSCLSFSLALILQPAGFAFSHASTKPCSKSSLLINPSKGSLMFDVIANSLHLAASSLNFLESGLRCHHKSSEKIHRMNVPATMPGSTRVVSGTKTALHRRESPYFASASSASMVNIGRAVEIARVGLKDVFGVAFGLEMNVLPASRKHAAAARIAGRIPRDRRNTAMSSVMLPKNSQGLKKRSGR